MIRGLTNMKSESMDLYMAIGPEKLYMRAHEISSGTCRGLFGDLEATRDYRYVSTHSNRQGRWGVDFYLLVLGLTCGFYVNPRFHEESFSAGHQVTLHTAYPDVVELKKRQKLRDRSL